MMQFVPGQGSGSLDVTQFNFFTVKMKIGHKEILSSIELLPFVSDIEQF